VTSWSLPLHRGLLCHELAIRCDELEAKLAPVDLAALAGGIELPADAWGLALPAEANASYRAAFTALAQGLRVERTTVTGSAGGAELAAGTFIVRGAFDALSELAASPGAVALAADPGLATTAVTPRRIGLIETYFHDMDAGWTRYLLDSFRVPFTVLRAGQLESAELAKNFDVLVFPDVSIDLLTKSRGKKDGERYFRPTDYPPEFAKRISDDGLAALRAFLAGGGIVVSWGGSTELFLEGLGEDEDGDQAPPLPARDIAEELAEDGLDVPGSLLKVRLIADHPLTWGLPAEVGVFSEGHPVFATSIPRADADRRVIASHPEREILLSGYVEGEEILAGRPVMVWLRSGTAQLVLFGFNPGFRASTPGTYKLLFNSLLLPEARP
jgi:hypothetical protein